MKPLFLRYFRIYQKNNYLKAQDSHENKDMKSILPQDIPGQQLQTIMQTAIAPRPIAFASTVDAEGNVNLSPFSFSICSVPSLRLLFFHLQEG
jgi:hypothetical protein